MTERRGGRNLSLLADRIEYGFDPGAPTPEPNPCTHLAAEGGAVTSVSPVSDMSISEQKERSLESLALLRQRQETTRLHRIHYMRLARQYGATNFEIGTELGVSEAAVRGMLKRAGDPD